MYQKNLSLIVIQLSFKKKYYGTFKNNFLQH